MANKTTMGTKKKKGEANETKSTRLKIKNKIEAKRF